LYRVAVAYGESDADNEGAQVALYFEPMEQAAVREKYRLTANVLDAKRISVLNKKFTVVSGGETGCLMMVS
jgi:hypothetical protein